ncbi:MAG: ABC transporter ATP-binding protein [Solirubrobacteraceae bacterium]|nr:ABC transporter ATP-binding protein [Solirubrobacteraceae bacterium]
MEPIIALRGVTKRFGGVAAVDDITVDVAPGRCFAWLGPNGCGKTTLIRMMLGLARPSEGEITVRGYRIPRHSREALSRVGAIVEEPRFYPYMSGRDNLKLWAAHYDRAAAGRIDAELDRVGLTDAASKKVDAYSLGMRQRLGVARAMLNDPELLLLDEPTNGLDPAGLMEFRQMVRSLVDEGRTVFISSHILDEVERMADDVAIIQRGRMISYGSIADLTKGSASGAILVRVDDVGAAERAVLDLPFVKHVDAADGGGKVRITVAHSGDQELRATAERLVARGVGLFELSPQVASLESRFLEITGTSAGELAVPEPPLQPPTGPTFVSKQKGA